MRNPKRLTSHTRWDCKYHIIFIPKKIRKLIFGAIRKHLGTIFQELARQKRCGDRGGELNARSCSYVFEYSTETGGIECCGFY